MKYYLAYGSNLHVAQMQRRCPGAIAVGTATLHGWRLAFHGSKTGAYLTIVPDRRAKTPIGVWAIDDAHEHALDIYEGFPRFYRKQTFELELEPFRGEPRKITGMAYIMDETRPKGTPSELYVRTCMVGYDCFGFDKAPLLRAVSASLPRIRAKAVKR